MLSEKLMQDLPSEHKIREAADELQKHTAGYRTLVFLGGYGAFRDWNYGIRQIFKQHNPNLWFTYTLSQDDHPTHGVRPILSQSPSNSLKQYHLFLFETSIKEKDSPSLLGQLVWLLLNTEGRIWTSATRDYWGRVHFPIEHEYAKIGIPYSGPRQFLFENKRRIRNFIKNCKLGKESKRRAERIHYDFDTYLDERIGELLVAPRDIGVLKVLV